MMKGLLVWLDARFPLLSTWNRYMTEYYVPKNLNILYVFGAIALVVLANQFITGLWLTMFYTPSSSQAFASIQSLMRDVNYGWLFRYLHTTGASAFFIVVYLHMFRGLLYGSYKNPRELVWILGVILFVLLLAEAFFGYLLPWGQLSYWGAQVITSIFGAIPYVGKSLVLWLRGDYSVGNPTLQRFFALHVIGVALVIVLMVCLHIVAIHRVGSNNPQGIEIYADLDKTGKPKDGIPFHPYYVLKDLLAALVFLFILLALVFFIPNYFLEGTNSIPANPLITPDPIKPIWYMAPYYSILRAIPNKLGGIFAVMSAFGLLLVLPWLDRSPVRSMRYKGLPSRLFLGLLALSFITLGIIGQLPLTPLRIALARLAVVGYFAYFVLMPIYTRYEQTRPLPARIDAL